MTNITGTRPGFRRYLYLPGLMGVIALVLGVGWARAQLAARHRPTVTGTVLEVSRFFLRSEDNALFTVRYRYAVNGVAYERAEKLYTMTDQDGRHPIGLHNWVLRPSIVVYYDPVNPARATIEAGIQTGSILLIVFGVVALGISIAVRRPRRRVSPLAVKICPGGTGENHPTIPPSLQDEALSDLPDTSCLANFRLSLRDAASLRLELRKRNDVADAFLAEKHQAEAVDGARRG